MVMRKIHSSLISYAVSNMYEQRETFEVKTVIEAMARLLFAHRKESW